MSKMGAHQLEQEEGAAHTAQVVASYPGADISQTRERLFVRFEQRPLRSTRIRMLQAGFRALDRNVFAARPDPHSIFSAQEILNEVCKP